MACLALLAATAADVAFASTFDARAMQILIHGVLLDTPCCMKNAVISLQRVNGRMGTLFRNLRDHFPLVLGPSCPVGDEAGKSLPAHLIDQGSVIQAKFSGASFGPPITRPTPSSVQNQSAFGDPQSSCSLEM
jgi:hypothetical protein